MKRKLAACLSSLSLFAGVQGKAESFSFIGTVYTVSMGACAVYSDFTMLDFTGSDDNFEVSEEEINIGISMQKGNSGLQKAINSVLATLTPEDFKDWMNQAIAVQPMND